MECLLLKKWRIHCLLDCYCRLAAVVEVWLDDCFWWQVQLIIPPYFYTTVANTLDVTALQPFCNSHLVVEARLPSTNTTDRPPQQSLLSDRVVSKSQPADSRDTTALRNMHWRSSRLSSQPRLCRLGKIPASPSLEQHAWGSAVHCCFTFAILGAVQRQLQLHKVGQTQSVECSKERHFSPGCCCRLSGCKDLVPANKLGLGTWSGWTLWRPWHAL